MPRSTHTYVFPIGALEGLQLYLQDHRVALFPRVSTCSSEHWVWSTFKPCSSLNLHAPVQRKKKLWRPHKFTS